MCVFAGVVSRLLVSSRSHDSLSLDWDRPHYFTGSLRGILEYRLLHSAGSESRWLYVEGNSDQLLPTLKKLEEFTNYSIRMAVVDEAGRLCVFNQPLIAQTGILWPIIFTLYIQVNTNLKNQEYRNGIYI